MIAEIDSATTSFEAWARKEFTHFLGEDVGNAVADAFTYQVDLDAGVLESLLSTVDGLQQLVTKPQQWEALATMTDPATQGAEFAKDPKAFLQNKLEGLGQLLHADEITGDHPMRGVGHLAGDVAQLFVPGAGEAKAVGEGAGAVRAEASAVRAEGAAAGKGTEAIAGATRTDIAAQGSKLTGEFNKIGESKAPIKAPDAVPAVKEPSVRPAEPGGKAPAGAAGPAGAERAPVEAGATRPDSAPGSSAEGSTMSNDGSALRPDAGHGTPPHGLSDAQQAEIVSIERGLRPDPSEYLSKEFIEQHLQKFDNGATKFMLSENLELFGIGQRDGTTFVFPTGELEALMEMTQGDTKLIEGALGLPEGYFSSREVVRVDIPDPGCYGLRIPSGNEAGANSQWIPGGLLPDGMPEAIIDGGTVPPDGYTVNTDFREE